MISPKVFIIAHSADEEQIWHGRKDFDIGARKIAVPGLSNQHPDVFCTADGEVCQVTTTMGLVNAALTVSAILSYPDFDLTKTYFLIAGLAGINPATGTLGSVTIPRYVIQVDLQYELDAREIPTGWSTGYFPQGAMNPTEPPQIFYGTEVFELNQTLRDVAVAYAGKATLQESAVVAKHCQLYGNAVAKSSPSILTADVAASNVFFHGSMLSKTIENTFSLFTNNRAIYGLTAQEDSATLAALLRGALQKKVVYSRIIVLRAASNFDQPPPAEPVEIPIHSGHGGFDLSKENLWLVGSEILKGIRKGWEEKFAEGAKADNYVGDIYGSLGGKPEFRQSVFLR
ncbi:purine nucleoside permease [Calycina marina]|uniref:Purine nucleoside permease n=1 Tax=Calycina marina TaxID=1763456 RepID=A0A9P8CD11_9HELO|nr:purine nucleoside permease [Calycina marina]